MKIIWKIFCKDIKGISTNFFALVVALGLCVIPSLYAWFNIYSNWDPYANTGAVKVAVFSQDKGFTKTGEDAEYVNMGESVLDSLHDNDKLGWTFPESREKTLAGVKSGEYYAAIIIGEDFSESMYNCIYNGMEHPTVTYYENSKKNAVATKITDSGKGSLQENINAQFVEVVVNSIMESVNAISDGDTNLVEEVAAQLKALYDNLQSYNTTIEGFRESNTRLQESINSAASVIPDIQRELEEGAAKAQEAGQQAGTSVAQYLDNMDAVFQIMAASLDGTEAALREAIAAMDAGDITLASERLRAAADSMDKLIESTGELSSAIGSIETIGDEKAKIAAAGVKAALEMAQLLENSAKSLLAQGAESAANKELAAAVWIAAVRPVAQQCLNQMPAIRDALVDKVRVNLETAKEAVTQSVGNIEETLVSLGGGLTGLESVMGSLGGTVGSANGSLESLQTTVNHVSGKLGAIVEKLNSASEDDAYQMLLDLMEGDPEAFGTFFAEPVQVTTVNVYETANYGSAVTPFYTTLALWVGALILVALIKVQAEPKGDFAGGKLWQMYFGRLLIFLLMGQIQAVIVVVGDLYLLKVQCLDKGLFMLAASITSFTFTLLIYTLTLSFGDMGKALAVVMVVIQIAGSSGTYPIELLPDFFQKIYIYFPFPYAINAMRECVSGSYGQDYWIALGQLLIFAAAALLLGLLIRKPFIGLNHFMEKRMHETKMM